MKFLVFPPVALVPFHPSESFCARGRAAALRACALADVLNALALMCLSWGNLGQGMAGGVGKSSEGPNIRGQCHRVGAHQRRILQVA